MTKKVIPFGNRIMVKRRRVGEKLGSVIIAAEETADRPTDIADVVYVPEHSFADKELIGASETIIQNLTKRAQAGSSSALKGLLEFNFYLKMKSLKPGDTVFISKYVGTDFHATGESGMLTLVNTDDIIGVVKKDS